MLTKIHLTDLTTGQGIYLDSASIVWVGRAPSVGARVGTTDGRYFRVTEPPEVVEGLRTRFAATGRPVEHTRPPGDRWLGALSAPVRCETPNGKSVIFSASDVAGLVALNDYDTDVLLRSGQRITVSGTVNDVSDTIGVAWDETQRQGQ